MDYKDSFLKRLMESTEPTKVSEATSEEDREDGVVDGFAIPLDAQARAISNRVKMPMARRIVALFSMSGIPGRYMSSEEVEGSVLQATDMLRKKASTRKAFLDFYEALAKANGYATPEDQPIRQDDEVQESEGDAEDSKYIKAVKHTAKSFATWRRQARAAAPDVWFDGDIDIASAFVGKNPYVRNETTTIGEWDGETGWIDTTFAIERGFLKEAPEQKKGNYLHKLFTTVLIELGLPESLAGVTAPGAVQAGLHRTAQMIEEDGALERTLRLLAMRMGIKADEVRQGVDDVNEEEELEEAADAGNDEFTKDMMALVSALGIPDEILERRRPQVVQAMRERKQTLRNRGTIETMVKRLTALLTTNTVDRGQADAEE